MPHISGVILSVVGSLLGFTVSPKIEKIIQRGMIKAAITTNGWITTAGYNAGYLVMLFTVTLFIHPHMLTFLSQLV